MSEFVIVSAYFEITNQCNLNCATCYNSSGYNHIRIETPVEKILSGIHTLKTLCSTKEIYFAGGEPTIHSRFDEIIAHIYEYPEIKFYFITNGTVHNQLLIDLFNNRKNIGIQISLDGSCEEINARTRGKGNFDKARDFILMLDRKHKKPIVKMVVSQYNITDVEPFYRKIVEWGAIPEFAFVDKIGNAKNNWKDMSITPMQKIAVLKLIDKLNNELNISAKLPFCTSHCPLAEDYMGMVPLIMVDGTIMPCQSLYDLRFSLGNLYNFDPELFVEQCNRISELILERQVFDYNCYGCIVRSTCYHGCMAQAMYNTGDPSGNDGNCEYRKLQFVQFDFKKQMSLMGILK